MTRQSNVRNLVLIGLFSAIIILQTFTPLLGYLRFFGLVEFTIIHITVILGACLLGPAMGAILGGVWGVTSLILAYQSGGVLTPLFYNPLISVVPRIIVGFIAGWVFALLSKKINATTSSVVASVIGAITNTVLVLSGFYFFGYDLIFNVIGASSSGPSDAVLMFIFSLVGTNTIAEIVAAAIIVPAIVVPLQKLLQKTR